MSTKLRRFFAALVGVIACASASVAIGWGYLQITNNFATVVEDELYRSAQPTARQLESYVRRYGIKTVINLRGANPGKPWYDEERQAASKLAVQLVDFPMSARELFPATRAAQLIELFRTAEKPILVHCMAGADRTGLASVIYTTQLAGIDEETAEWQLSLLYGHIGLRLLSPTYAMNTSWEDLEAVFGIPSS